MPIFPDLSEKLSAIIGHIMNFPILASFHFNISAAHKLENPSLFGTCVEACPGPTVKCYQNARVSLTLWAAEKRTHLDWALTYLHRGLVIVSSHITCPRKSCANKV